MALTPGTRLGPYEVTAQIGVEGMGEVSRATDTTLARPVAIKVLPDAIAQDSERLVRFDREARTLAALNHSNIAAIYGIAQGPAEAGHHVRALVMELVEGPTLADRIAQGAIPLDEAASFATRALEQDPEAFLGIFLRGRVAAKRGRLESAVRDMRRAHELKPGDASVPIELARHLFSAGQERSALGKSVFEQVLQVDPLSPLNHVQSAWRLHFGGLPGAEQAVRRSIELSDPDNPARMYAAYSLAIMGRREEAVALLDEVASVLGTTPYGSMSAFFARALQGDAEGAVRHVTPLLEQSARWVEYLALFLSSGHALIGRRDDALGWLRRSVEQGFINYPVLSKDPLLESLHGDAEFEALMQQVKQRWQAFEA